MHLRWWLTMYSYSTWMENSSQDRESVVEFRVVVSLGRPCCAAGGTVIWLVSSLVGGEMVLSFAGDLQPSSNVRWLNRPS
jgi:hypothetical protein